MKLGTVVFDNKIYNLDYMTADELKELLDKIENVKKTSFQDVKKILN